MSDSPPKVLILGHSFVRRLKTDLRANFDKRASFGFGLKGSATIEMHGVGGRTVQKLRANDLSAISRCSPDIVLLEIGTNDLSHSRPEVVGSEIECLVNLLSKELSVRVVGVCLVTPRATSRSRESRFNERAALLNQYLRVVIEPLPRAFCWRHKGFSQSSISPFLSDGVHFNKIGQYFLYRSYRGAILNALRLL